MLPQSSKILKFASLWVLRIEPKELVRFVESATSLGVRAQSVQNGGIELESLNVQDQNGDNAPVFAEVYLLTVHGNSIDLAILHRNPFVDDVRKVRNHL